MSKKKITEEKESLDKSINQSEESEKESSSADIGEKGEERSVVFEEALEAILFAAGHPISYATLARVFEMTPAKVRDLVFEYSLKYNDSSIPRGVILLTYGDSCQLCTKKYYLNEIREALGIKKSGTLSTSSMEALAIVAYNQPVTRAFVDTLRRADSSYAMNNLIDRGLIEAKGRLDAPGRPMLYGTTTDFLRAFGLKDVTELPKTTEEMDAMFAKAKTVEDANNEAVQEEIEFPEESSNDPENTDIKKNISEESGSVEINEDSNAIVNDDYDSDPSADDHILFDDN